jgi:hypothetical protein
MTIPKRLKLLLLFSTFLFGFIGIGIANNLQGGGDWLAYYSAGHFFLEGRTSDIYDLNTFRLWQSQYSGDYFAPFLYAPVYSLFCIPLAIVPIAVSRILWLIIGLGISIAAARFSLNWSGLTFSQNTLVMFSFGPLAYCLSVGQVSPITLFLFTIIAGIEWKAERGYLPGFIAGLGLYKPQLLIPLILYWVFNKRWRTMAGFILSSGAIGITSFMISPIASKDYLLLSTRFINLSKTVNERGANAALYSFSPFLGILVSVIVIVLLIMISRKRLNHLTCAALWISPVIFTPYLGVYDLVLLALPVTFLFQEMRHDRYLRWAIIFMWLSPLLATIGLEFHIVTVSAIILLVICIWRANQNKLLGNYSEDRVQNFSETLV